MSGYLNVFKRYELKYRLSALQHQRLMKILAHHAEPDSYGVHTISNIYYDTDRFDLIRQSIEKPLYKEKLRLRSYGIPGASDGVFLELKKKYDGVVYKRRIQLPHSEAVRYLDTGIAPQGAGQILHEIDWFVKRYRPQPKVVIACERLAMTAPEDPGLRITFDTGIRYRETLLDLSKGHWGQPLLASGEVLMELKVEGAMPLWLSQTLSDLEIYPTSYSKYGQCYKDHLMHTTQGGIYCA